MANRRFGGGGGPQRGNRSFSNQQQFQGGGVNPWQGGIAPSNSLNPGLLSQLSANAPPAAQLALALSNLLQPQQQLSTTPPSLLSLNTSGFNQDNFNSQNRFANRGRSDFRRPEPYNKNRNTGGGGGAGGNWRDNRGSRNASAGRSGSRSNLGKDRKSNASKSPDKSKADKSYKGSKDSAVKSKRTDDTDETVDLSLDESRDEEGQEKKRDWKEEKNLEEKEGGEEGEHDTSVDLTEDTDDEKKGKGADARKHREGRYQGIPESLLHCFVCNKSMWDGESFQNHIRGKAHKQMLESLEESFQITVNILRENMRLTEEKKLIEVDRMQRRNYNRRAQEPQCFCNMCDLKFFGKIIAHRKTESHQRLKRFLHPKCTGCNQEFPSRMEWVEHRFTPDHLRKVAEIIESGKEEADGAVIEEETEANLEPLLEESLQTEEENPVLELSDDLVNLQNRIPVFQPNRPLAKENVKPASGFLCDMCVRFLPNEEILQAHLVSERHYHKFVGILKKKYKRTHTDDKVQDDDGNWKRRKLDHDEEDTGEGKDAELDNSGTNGDALYDPEEACNDVTMETADSSQQIDEGKESDLDITAEVKEDVTKVSDEIKGKEEEEIKEEKEAPADSSPSPRTTRRGGVGAGGAVKNGAGPKSKKVVRK